MQLSPIYAPSNGNNLSKFVACKNQDEALRLTGCELSVK